MIKIISARRTELGIEIKYYLNGVKKIREVPKGYKYLIDFDTKDSISIEDIEIL